jgi:tetratricopeptide (TPR) repeat protein
MSALADLPELIGFFSYSREDDEDSNGALSALRERIQRELRGQLGRSMKTFRLWQDKQSIASGSLWEAEIKAAAEQSVFFIPIITPTVVRSPYCRFELESFLGREAALGRSDLVFPILYIKVPALDDDVQREKDPVLSIIAKRQYLDWREFRHRDVTSPDVKEAVERFCAHICEALYRRWVSPEERSKIEEDTARERAEQERIAKKAEAKQRAEGALKKKEADARRRAEEERKAEDKRLREDAEIKSRAEKEERRKQGEAARRENADPKAADTTAKVLPTIAAATNAAAGGVSQSLGKLTASVGSKRLMMIGGAVGVLGLGLFLVMKDSGTPAPPPPVVITPQPAYQPKTENTEPLSADAKRAVSLIESADADLANKYYDDAIVDYTDAIQLDPGRAAAFSGRGSAYYEKGDYDRALADENEALRLNPKYREAYLRRGFVYAYGKQEYDSAIADYTAAIRVDPKYRDGYFHRGVAYQNGKKDYDRALADYQLVIRLDPNFSLAYYNRAQILRASKKDYDRAIADYTESIRLDPKYSYAYMNRGLAYEDGKRDYTRAIADYTEAIKLDSKLALAFYYRGQAKQKVGDARGGDADITTAKDLDPTVGD